MTSLVKSAPLRRLPLDRVDHLARIAVMGAIALLDGFLFLYLLVPQS